MKNKINHTNNNPGMIRCPESIKKNLDEINKLYESPENKRRLSLWKTDYNPIRGETQFHGIPRYTVDENTAMPVTAECLEKVWTEIFGFTLREYYTDPDVYLDTYLKIKLKKFKEFGDDTPLDRKIPIWFGNIFEAGVIGQETLFPQNSEPAFGNKTLFENDSDIPGTIDFDSNEYVQLAVRFYNRIKDIVGKEFNVIFPQWFRGPQGVALYIRGFQNFLIDIYERPPFAHHILRFITRTEKEYNRWRSKYVGEPIEPGDLFNDDIPLMSPDDYTKFILPYEQELCNFWGGIYYWHSCGDITKHAPEIFRLNCLHLLDFGVSMEDKMAALQSIPVAERKKLVLELRVLAQKHIQIEDEDHIRDYMKIILESCKENGIKRYVLRSSGMSLLLGAEQDVKKLRRWVEITKETQALFPGT